MSQMCGYLARQRGRLVASGRGAHVPVAALPANVLTNASGASIAAAPHAAVLTGDSSTALACHEWQNYEMAV